jgi:hypothetical protein
MLARSRPARGKAATPTRSEHLPEIGATALAQYLLSHERGSLSHEHGSEKVRDMLPLVPSCREVVRAYLPRAFGIDLDQMHCRKPY